MPCAGSSLPASAVLSGVGALPLSPFAPGLLALPAALMSSSVLALTADSAGRVIDAVLCGLDRARLRVCQPASDGLRLSGLMAYGRSGLSPSPRTRITTPSAPAVLAGNWRARKLSLPALRICWPSFGNWRSSPLASP